jgi:hypothetical protein
MVAFRMCFKQTGLEHTVSIWSIDG